MTNLTKQWEKGELPEGRYYIKVTPDFEYSNDIAFYTGGYFELYSDKDIEQVLEKVPSYEQWQANLEENTKLKTENKWYSEQLNEGVKKEGQLKELLKECRSFIEDYGNTELLSKIDQVLGEE